MSPKRATARPRVSPLAEANPGEAPPVLPERKNQPVPWLCAFRERVIAWIINAGSQETSWSIALKLWILNWLSSSPVSEDELRIALQYRSAPEHTTAFPPEITEFFVQKPRPIDQQVQFMIDHKRSIIIALLIISAVGIGSYFQSNPSREEVTTQIEAVLKNPLTHHFKKLIVLKNDCLAKSQHREEFFEKVDEFVQTLRDIADIYQARAEDQSDDESRKRFFESAEVYRRAARELENGLQRNQKKGVVQALLTTALRGVSDDLVKYPFDAEERYFLPSLRPERE